MNFLRLVSGYIHTDCIRSALEIYTLEEIIQDYKSKWHNRVLRMDSSRLAQKVKKYQSDRGTNDREDGWRKIFQTEQSNKNLS
jgi:hypothetical protein